MAWRLHCRLREELIAFLRDLEGGRFLPKHWLSWQPEGDPQAVAQQARREAGYGEEGRTG